MYYFYHTCECYYTATHLTAQRGMRALVPKSSRLLFAIPPSRLHIK